MCIPAGQMGFSTLSWWLKVVLTGCVEIHVSARHRRSRRGPGTPGGSPGGRPRTAPPQDRQGPGGTGAPGRACVRGPDGHTRPGGEVPLIDCGIALVSMAVAITLGATIMSDITVLAHQEPVFGAEPSDTTRERLAGRGGPGRRRAGRQACRRDHPPDTSGRRLGPPDCGESRAAPGHRGGKPRT
jgi:hypothetical protein